VNISHSYSLPNSRSLNPSFKHKTSHQKSVYPLSRICGFRFQYGKKSFYYAPRFYNCWFNKPYISITI